MASASLVERATTRNSAGRFIAVTELEEISRLAGAPCVCIHRGILQRILLEELPASSIQTGARCIGFDNSTSLMEDGRRVEADVLIGADGVSSVIRAGLHGPSQPRYAGYTCWRAILRHPAVLPDCSTLLTVGAGTQFGLWPCGDGQYYWFLTKNAPQGTIQTKADAVAVCRDWAAPIPEIIEATPEASVFQNDIVDRPPIPWWGRGRVTLVGDAAHPTTPNLDQGACQALEDAIILADCLSTHQTTEAALREYERRRIPRTTAIVKESWRIGQLLQLEQPVAESVRNWFMETSLSRHIGTQMFRRILTYRIPKLPLVSAPSH